MILQAISNLIHSQLQDKYVVTTSLFYPMHTGISFYYPKRFNLLLADVEKNMSSITAEILAETVEGV